MIWYLIGINIITYLVYAIDKYLARKGLYRISEYSLFVLAFFGGGVGALLGMRTFHHKTKKKMFWVLNILFTVMWIIILTT